MLKVKVVVVGAILLFAEVSSAQMQESTIAQDCSESLALDNKALEICKAKKEISILNEQVTRLKEQRDFVPRGYSFVLDPGILGAILGAFAVLAGGIITVLWTGYQNQKQKKVFFSESLIERERHNLQLLGHLGSSNHKEQITAAATILHRMQNEWAKNHDGLGLERRQIRIIRGAERLEEALFAKVLISVLRIVCANDEENQLRLAHVAKGNVSDDFFDKALNAITEEKLDFELQKFIADELVLTLGARSNSFDSSEVFDASQTMPAYLTPSPLKVFHGHHLDWQRTSLRRVWWKGVDARCVDFYRADFTEAGLRASHLEGAVFFEAKLDKAVLRSSNLRKANLMGASLTGARLDGADLTKAILSGADLTNAILSGADLSEANLKGAILSGVALDGANLKGALFNEETVPPKEGSDLASLGMIRS